MNTATADARPELPSAAEWTRASRDEQADADRRMQVALLAFYLIDATLLAGYWLLGLAPGTVPLAFAATGIALATIFIRAVHTEWYASLRNSGAVLIQTLVALVLMLATCVMAPQLTLLMLMTIVGVISTGAMRMPGLATVVASLAAAAGALAVLQLQAGHPVAPVADWPQRLLTAVFALWTLAKGASTNIVGAQWRMELSDSHTRLANALAKVEELASRDELTGLPNRRSILQTLDAELERMRRTKVSMGVGLLDIDHFKRINDSHGHALGDAVLKAFGLVARGSLRDIDRLGRFGGEEFLMVLTGPADADGMARVGERVRERLARHDWQALAPDLQVTVSIGLAVAEPGDTAETLLERADRSLYQAKEAGRNRVVVAAPPDQSAAKQ
jgi:diguanylate cyclase